MTLLASRAAVATIAASVGASVLSGFSLLLSGQFGPLSGFADPATLVVTVAIMLVWVPAFALVPASIIGFFVERPLARRIVERKRGGFPSLLAASIGAGLLLWLLLRAGLWLTNSSPVFFDELSLLLFSMVGLCSGLAWWLLVIDPQRRE